VGWRGHQEQRTLGDRVVQAEVEDRVHHPGHRRARVGADADEEGGGRVAELGAHRLLEACEGGVRLGADLVGDALRPDERVADLGGEGKAGRDGKAEGGHLGA